MFFITVLFIGHNAEKKRIQISFSCYNIHIFIVCKKQLVMPKKEKKNIGTSFNILSFEGKQMSLYEQDNKQSFL